MEHTYTDQFLLGLEEFMGDLKFGIAASQSRNEPIKRSRAVRRTLDKVCSYVIWVMMAYTFGQVGYSFGRIFRQRIVINKRICNPFYYIYK